MAVKLVLRNQSGKPFASPWLAPRLRRVLADLRVTEGEWTVLAVEDSEMATLHGRMMGIGGTTDVLTFDMAESDERKTKHERQTLELDTVICVDEARRRAREMGHAVREELLLYAIHSLLHVQGYDDVTTAGAAAMHRREDEILVKLGVGTVYSGKGKKKISLSADRASGRAGKCKGLS